MTPINHLISNNHVVIMAGGIGSRLWPASTPDNPKQFIDVLGVGRSLLQLTVDRFLPLCDISHFWVVTSSVYVDIVMSQLPDIPGENIIAEPEPRNTAPCIALACRKIQKKFPEANVVVTPADALVIDTEKFRAIVAESLEFTVQGDRIVTLGIVPSRPETGYGYICAGNEVNGNIRKVRSFKEKPDKKTAETYLSEGNYFWNAGIFVWTVKTIEKQMRLHAPEICGIMDKIEPALYTPGENECLSQLFHRCEKISIDYAVMEKSEDIYVVPGSFGWSDLGSWGSVKARISNDKCGNALIGNDIRLFDSRNCIVHLPDIRTAVIDGLDGYVVAENSGRLLICRLSEEQHIKDYSSNSYMNHVRPETL